MLSVSSLYKIFVLISVAIYFEGTRYITIIACKSVLDVIFHAKLS